MKVLLTDYAWPDVDIERGILAAAGVELIVAQQQDEDSLAALAADVDAIMTCWARVTERVMAASGRCRIVARMGIGLDNIDVGYCTRAGIPVTNVPDYCLQEVAEHTLALLLSLARKTAFYHHASKQGRYELQAGPPLRRLAGQTLGIVGLGAIGGRVAELSLALGLRVVAVNRSGKTALAGVKMTDLQTLLAVSDFVSLHVPLTPSTRRLIGSGELRRMRPSAYLINTARGGLIDHAALAAALSSGALAGAALDVQDPEPPDLSQPPYDDPRVIVTPHAAFVSAESLAELRTRAATQVADRLRGRTPHKVLNPAVLDAGER